MQQLYVHVRILLDLGWENADGTTVEMEAVTKDRIIIISEIEVVTGRYLHGLIPLEMQ
jgi:hypothetical protein